MAFLTGFDRRDLSAILDHDRLSHDLRRSLVAIVVTPPCAQRCSSESRRASAIMASAVLFLLVSTVISTAAAAAISALSRASYPAPALWGDLPGAGIRSYGYQAVSCVYNRVSTG